MNGRGAAWLGRRFFGILIAMTTTMARTVAPELDLDPFAADFLTDPYPYHQMIREAGPVVRLPKYGVWAMARYADVRAALDDWQTFCSGRGVGLSDFAKETPWRPPSLLLEVDPPLHDRTRGVVRRILTPSALKALRPGWAAKAEELADKLAARGVFDAITDLAEVYPLAVFPDAAGVRTEGRENLLLYSTLAFNAFGPRNQLTEDSMKNAAAVTQWVADSCKRENLAPGGFGAQVFEAADRGEVTEAEAERLVRSFLTAGVDTTVNGIGNMLHAFATHPGQWEILRQSPELIRYVLEEALRFNATVQTFFRTTIRDVEVGGVRIPEGEKVLLFLAGANRDPRQWPDPDRFDIRRKTTGHLGFGYGIHNCIGQMIARLEAELILEALLPRVQSIELAGDAVVRLNNTLHAFASVPVRVR